MVLASSWKGFGVIGQVVTDVTHSIAIPVGLIRIEGVDAIILIIENTVVISIRFALPVRCRRRYSAAILNVREDATEETLPRQCPVEVTPVERVATDLHLRFGSKGFSIGRSNALEDNRPNRFSLRPFTLSRVTATKLPLSVVDDSGTCDGRIRIAGEETGPVRSGCRQASR